jgi:succinate dehydrogenase flavin-adding protein (antitoxin of CptAB toxin-antitoxin module)
MEDRIFCGYWKDLIIRHFEEHTGYKVSEKQKQELEKFLKEWGLKNIEKVREVE